MPLDRSAGFNMTAAATDHGPAATDHGPAASDTERAASDNEPTAGDNRSAASDTGPVASDSGPAVTDNERAASAEAHAKINLRLRVFGRDATGYHGVETLLMRTSLTDTVRLSEASPRPPPPSPSGVSLEVDGPAAAGVPDGRDNLCWRAASLFLDRAFGSRRSRPSVHIGLTKRIPAGAGLGGGSADAAATLRLLAARWPRLDERDLVEIAGELGSDVPFALLGAPMALGWGRGCRLLPLRPPRPRPALLVLSPVHVATPDAYRWLADQRDGTSGTRGRTASASILPGATRLASWESLDGLVRNDLQAPVFARHAELARGLEQVRACDPAAAAMTGSGSALFAIFRSEAERTQAAARLSASGLATGTRLEAVRLPV